MRHAWRLTVEPVRQGVLWSLLHAPPGRVAEAVDGGLLRDEDLAEVARSLPPGRPEPRPGAEWNWRSALLDPVRERLVSRRFGESLVPSRLRSALGTTRVAEPEHSVEVAARGWAALVPWDAVIIDDAGTRLCEVSRVVCVLPAGVLGGRARRAPQLDPTWPGLCVVDPGPPTGRHASLYAAEPDRYPDALWGGLHAEDLLAPGEHSMTAHQLGGVLGQAPWSRLLYLGHIAAPAADAPAQTSLVFDLAGRDDLLSAGDWLADPARWPAPDRVALIGCGSDDAQHLETGGLSAAAVNAGATLVTTTRWVLPADGHHEGAHGTTELALAVHRAHRQPDAVAALRAWQLGRADQWRDDPSVECAPLFWGALCTYMAPPARGGTAASSPLLHR